jgi:hypothetical protein
MRYQKAGLNPAQAFFDGDFDATARPGDPPKDTRFTDYVDQSRSMRARDMSEGRARGEELFPDGSTANMRDIIERRRAFLQGFTPDEMNASRDQMNATNRTEALTAERQLRGTQARNGVRGPAAAAQVAGVHKDLARKTADNEQKLFLENAAEKRGQLDKYGAEIMKQRYGQLATELGYGGLGVSDRSAATQRVAGEDYARAANDAANSGGKK